MPWNRATDCSGRPLAFLCEALLLVSLLFSGCQMQSNSATGDGPQPSQPLSASISFCDDSASSCQPANSFSISSVRGLAIKVDWQSVPAGNHSQKLDIFMPGGGLFQSTQMGFMIPNGGLGPFSTVRIVPIAGTWVQQRKATGDWNVAVSLDGQQVASQKLELNP
ncbi:MAG: hypothetical protein ACREAC_05815 [Blastocatellia bacterium]